LKASNTSAEDQHPGWLNRSGCGHQHGYVTIQFGCRQQNSLVTSNVGLGGEHIHRLSSADAGQQFEGDGGNGAIVQQLG
jgi:hypothetical protein